MPVSLTSFVSGDVVDADVLQGDLNKIEEFVNEDIDVTDFTGDSGWIKRQNLYKPEFYGSPNPRMLAPTSDVYHRFVPHGDPDLAHFHPEVNRQGQVAHGQAVTFKVPRDDTVVSVMANLWAYEMGGELFTAITTVSPTVGTGTAITLLEFTSTRAAAIAIRWDAGNDWEGTRRHVNIGTDETNEGYITPDPSGAKISTTFANNLARKNISMIAMNTLSQGVHSVGVYVTPTAATNGANQGEIVIGVRSIVVEVHAGYTGGNKAE